MARGINKVILVGSLGQDPEVRYTGNGGAVCNLTLATSESWKDKQTGEQKEKTEWHRVVIFGKLAEIAAEYARKGTQVYVEGALQTRKWQDQQGVDRYTTEVVINVGGTFQLLGGKRSDDGQQQPQKQQKQQSGTNNGWGKPQQSAPAQSNEPPMDFNDDIPF